MPPHPQLQRSKLVNGAPDVEMGSTATAPQRGWRSVISPIFVQAFTLTFLAEWGDRSQLTTIVLAAREVRLEYLACFSAGTIAYKRLLNVNIKNAYNAFSQIFLS